MINVESFVTNIDQPTGAGSSQVRSNKIKFLAIHLGAKDGKYDEKSAQNSSAIAEQICKTVMSDSKVVSAVDAVVQLVKLMENNPKFNCGNGSNLTMRGEVECDASLMCGKTRSWASVGAISGCRNPIVLANRLLEQRNKPQPLGLVSPSFLIGSGANQFMREECPSLGIQSSRLITTQKIDKYQKLKSRYDRAKRDQHKSESIPFDIGSRVSQFSNELMDEAMVINDELETVGAVAIDDLGNFASAISSGGLWLKQKGRIGQAAIPGAGCWCENPIAVVTTGTGEYISANMLAKRFHDKLKDDWSEQLKCGKNMGERITEVTKQCYRELHNWSVLSQKNVDRLPVALLAISELDEYDDGCNNRPDKRIYLTLAHNTNSLIVVHMHHEQAEPTSQISFLKDAEIATKAVILNITQVTSFGDHATTTSIATQRQVLSMS